MSSFKLTIVSDSGLIYSGGVRYCGITTLSGSIGFEANHEPFLGVLKQGSEINYTEESGSEHTAAVADGILSFSGNECSVVVTTE